MSKQSSITIRDFSQQRGHLQRAIASGSYDPYHGELGDGKMASLAAQELRTGEEVQIPERSTPPSDADRVFALMKELIGLLMPQSSGLVVDEKDRPEWKFDKRKNKWVEKKLKRRKRKKAAKKAKRRSQGEGRVARKR